MTDKINDKPIKIKGTRRASLALLLSFLTFATTGYFYYQSLKVHAHTTYQLQALDHNFNNNTSTTEASLAAINKELSDIKTKVNTLSNDKFGATNYQINTLISLANQSLVVYHDVGAAIKLLTYANNDITGNNNAIYTELKVALNSDLNQLKQIPVLDKVVIASQLNTIIYNTQDLELISKPESIQSNITNKTDLPKWKEFLFNIKNKLSGLVQITSSDSHQALNLLPQHEVIIHQNIKLDVLNARMALLQDDDTNWRYSLNDVKNILSSYFVNNTEVQSIITQVDQLEKLNISTKNVNLDQTLKALNRLNNLSQGSLVN